MTNHKKIYSQLGEAVLLPLLFLGLFLYRKEVSAGIVEGILYSLSALIPSILPFMFLSTLVTKLSIYGTICRIFSPVTKYLFRLPENTGGVTIAGLTCGYPVGAKLTAELLKRGGITEEEADRLILFCVNPGIPFTVLFVGGEILGSLKTGMILYFSVLLSNILAGFLLSIGKALPEKKRGLQKSESLSRAMSFSADSTLRACGTMAMYILIFRGLFALLHASGVYQFLVEKTQTSVFTPQERAALLSFLLEVTTGISDAFTLSAPLSVYGFGLGFGGICIIFQLVSFFDGFRQNITDILISRLLSAIVSCNIISLIDHFHPFPRKTLEVFSSIDHPIPSATGTPLLGLVSLCLLFGLYILREIGVAKAKEK